MAILFSDDFTGVTDGLGVGGRSLNNALGGTGSRVWASIGNTLVGNGTTGVKGGNTTSGIVVQEAGLTAHKARIRFNPNSASSAFWVVAQRTVSDGGNGNHVAAILVNNNSLRIRVGSSQGWGAGSDSGPKTITTLNNTTDYWLEFEISGLACVARVLNSDTTVYDSTTHTLSSAPGGDYWGFGFVGSGNSTLFDDWVVEDLGDPPPPTIVRRRPVAIM